MPGVIRLDKIFTPKLMLRRKFRHSQRFESPGDRTHQEYILNQLAQLTIGGVDETATFLSYCPIIRFRRRQLRHCVLGGYPKRREKLYCLLLNLL